VDILERRVSALQSLVDDLSRKLAAVQMTLDRAPLSVVTEQPSIEKPSRKRMKDIDEDFLNDDLRLSEDDILSLFDPASLTLDGFDASDDIYEPTQQTPVLSQAQSSQQPNQQALAQAKSKQDQQEKQAQEFLSTLMSTPQFHAAITSSIQEKPAPKVESIPHLSVC